MAHDLPNRLAGLRVENYAPLLERADRALFKLSNYRTYIEIGSDPAFKDQGIDWNTVKGHEYLLFEEVMRKIKLLEEPALSATSSARIDMYSLDYLVEKFEQAVFDLATGEGDARSRLEVAYHRFWTIPLLDYPE